MIRRALRAGTIADAITPVLLGSAFKNKGVQPLATRSSSTCGGKPTRGTAGTGLRSQVGGRGGARALARGAVRSARLQGHVRPFVGKLTYFRVYSGQVKAGGRVLNTTSGKTERIRRILRMHANREEREEISRQMRSSRRAQGLDDGRHAGCRHGADRARVDELPDPVISVAIEPKTKGDQDKLTQGLQRLAEDPTFRVTSDEETGQTLIAQAWGYLEIIVDRLLREFKVDANVGRPQVAYRETVSRPVEKVRGRFVRQTGARASTARRDQPASASPARATSSSTRSSRQDRASTSPPSTRNPRGDGVGHPRRLPGRGREDRARRRLRTTTSTRASAPSRSPARWGSRRP